VEHGALVLGENRYRIVVLPNVESISPDLYGKLEEFAREGGILVATGTLPRLSPGYRAAPAAHQAIKDLSKRLFEDPSAPGHLVQDEKSQLAEVLNRALPADVSVSSGNGEMGFVHRHTEEADIYFIANTSNARQQTKATFRDQQDRGAQWWDPMTGAMTPARIENQNPKGATVDLDLEPYGSRLLIFSRVRPSATPAVKSIGEIDVSKDWQVSFGNGVASQRMEQLRSWTDDAATRSFSGVATYEKKVAIGREQLANAGRVRLDFGSGQAMPEQTLRSGMQAWFEPPVHEAAAVYINHKRAGAVWCPPYSLDVTSLLKAGDNDLRIMVANTAINYMAGHSLPDYRLLNLRYGERFQAQDMDKVRPVTSGVLGPIRFILEK
jgi:hypothetical protein